MVSGNLKRRATAGAALRQPEVIEAQRLEAGRSICRPIDGVRPPAGTDAGRGGAVLPAVDQ